MMSKTGRNQQCPCGSGKKFKQCCLVAQANNRIDLMIAFDGDMPIFTVRPDGRKRTSGLGIPLDLPNLLLPQQAYAAYHMGKFNDAIEICEELNRRGERDERVLLLAFLAAAARGDQRLPACVESTCETETQLREDFTENHPVDDLWFSICAGTLDPDKHIATLTRLFDDISKGLYILPTTHPSPCLSIADWLLDHTDRTDLALKLVNCCLGWRYVYRRIEDLLKLAKLLDRLQAPKLFWTILGNLYFDFMYLDSVEQMAFMTSFLERGATANVHIAQLDKSQKTTDRIEGEFHQFCIDRGFPEHLTINDNLHKVFGLDEAREGNLTDRFKPTRKYDDVVSTCWLDKSLFAMRHPWFVLLDSNEQNFIRNGDNAFVTCDTGDYSMACLQWWRTVESVFKRMLIIPLGSLIDANPRWVDTDRIYAASLAPEQELEWERLFVRELADRYRRERLTLTQMLMILQKCLSDLDKGKSSDSLIRRFSSEHISQKLSSFCWIKSQLDKYSDMRSTLSPNVLTEQAIQSFRNAASHDKPMDYECAVVGRLLAIRILDFIHYPRYCLFEKLEELKQELAKKARQ